MKISELLTESAQKVDANYVYDLAKKIHHTFDDFGEGDLTDRLFWFDEYTLQELPIADIDLGEWDLDTDRVTEHMEEIVKSRGTMPPIVFDPFERSIIDGTHRANAYHNLGYTHIPAYVGTKKSADYGQREERD